MIAWEQINATCIFTSSKPLIFLPILGSELSTEKKQRRQEGSFHLIIRKDNPTARILQSRMFEWNSVPVRKHKQRQCGAEPPAESEKDAGG